MGSTQTFTVKFTSLFKTLEFIMKSFIIVAACLIAAISAYPDISGTGDLNHAFNNFENVKERDFQDTYGAPAAPVKLHGVVTPLPLSIHLMETKIPPSSLLEITLVLGPIQLFGISVNTLLDQNPIENFKDWFASDAAEAARNISPEHVQLVLNKIEAFAQKFQ